MKKSIPPRRDKKIIVIVGSTASGKSDLALRLAKLAQGKAFKKKGILGAEIISADSRQVYKGMDIGTGKVSKKEQKIVPHHLIDVVSPKKQFTADDFKKLGQKSINDIQCRYKVPIVVGGTGFYIDVMLSRIPIAEVPPNKKLRAQFDKLTVEHLFKMLQKLDPRRAKTVESKNKRRLIRALEIVLTTGKPVPIIYDLKPLTYNILWIGLNPANLKQRIKNRLDARLKPSYAKATLGRQGMIEEVIRLHKQGVSWKRLDDFGLEYRQISKYLVSEKFKVPALGKPKAKLGKSEKNFKNSKYYEKLLREIIKYSKHQMTWFRRNKEIKWINPPKGGQKIVRMVRKFLIDG